MAKVRGWSAKDRGALEVPGILPERLVSLQEEGVDETKCCSARLAPLQVMVLRLVVLVVRRGGGGSKRPRQERL